MPSPKKPKDTEHLLVLPQEEVPGTFSPQDMMREVTGIHAQLQDLATLYHELEKIKQLQARLEQTEAFVQSFFASYHKHHLTWSWEEILPRDQQNHAWMLSENRKHALIPVTQTMHNAFFGANSTIDLSCDLHLSVPDGMLIVALPHGNLADLDILCPKNYYGPGNHLLRLHFITTTRGVTLNTKDLVARLVALREA